MAAEIKKATGEEAKLISGSKGIFEVKRDGKLLYSKAETGRFPQPGEVTKLLQSP